MQKYNNMIRHVSFKTETLSNNKWLKQNFFNDYACVYVCPTTYTSIHLLLTPLSFSQIQKILTMYTPGDFEGKVPSSLIRFIGERCRQRDGSVGQHLLVHMDDTCLAPTTPNCDGNEGLHSTDTIGNLRALSPPASMTLDNLLIMIWDQFTCAPSLMNTLNLNNRHYSTRTICLPATALMKFSNVIGDIYLNKT